LCCGNAALYAALEADGDVVSECKVMSVWQVTGMHSYNPDILGVKVTGVVAGYCVSVCLSVSVPKDEASMARSICSADNLTVR
jgi:hypothetical protein